MGMLGRICFVATFVSAGLFAGMYVTSPEATREMLSTQSAVVQVRLQALAESATVSFAEQSAVARAFGNSTAVALAERLAAAQAQGEVLGASMVRVCGEQAAFAKLNFLAFSAVAQSKGQALWGSMVHAGGVYAAAAQLKFQAYSASAFDMGGEHAARAQAQMQDFANSTAHSFRQHSKVLSKYFQDVPVTQIPAKLYASSLPALKVFKASVVSATHHFIEQAPTYAANFTVTCRTVAANLKDFSQRATPLQLAGSLILSVIAIIGWSKFLRAMCCRRRVARAPFVPDVRTEILGAPSPLRERFAQLPQTSRRRRSASPGAVSKENAGASSEGNRDLASEQEVLHQLNTASVEELHCMPGLGEKSINMIVQYRSKAELQSLDDLVSKVGMRGGVVGNFAKAQGINY